MFVLFLNDMRSSKCESCESVAKADSREELDALLARERVEGYRDGTWAKSFRRGGPLEWYNEPLFDWHGVRNVGTAEDAAERARQAWHAEADRVPHVNSLLAG